MNNDCSKQLLLKVFEMSMVFFQFWFTVDYTLRIISTPNRLKYIFSPLGLVDLASILPLYIKLAMDPDPVRWQIACDNLHSSSVTVFRFLWLLRILMVLKFARFSQGLRLMALVLRYSMSALSLILVYGAVYVIIFATILFFLEADHVDTQFTSIPAASWWAIVTLTTLGYGDMVPATVGGKFVAALATILSILILAFPVSIVVDNMKKAYGQINAEEKNHNRYRMKRPSAAKFLSQYALLAGITMTSNSQNIKSNPSQASSKKSRKEAVMLPGVLQQVLKDCDAYGDLSNPDISNIIQARLSAIPQSSVDDNSLI